MSRYQSPMIIAEAYEGYEELFLDSKAVGMLISIQTIIEKKHE